MYILDTNAAYYLVNTDWTEKRQLALLQEKAADGRLKVALPPITVLELCSRIVEEPSWFEHVRAAARAVLDLKPATLPDPEQRMREITENVDLARQAYEHWLLILQTVAAAPDAGSLQWGFDDYATATHRSTDVARIAKYREDYEKQYIEDMLKVARQINPKYDDQVLRGKETRLPTSEQEALRKFFASGEWTGVFVTMLAYRGGTGVLPSDEGQLAVVVKKAKYFKMAYERLGLSMFCDGARPILKRKNDYNDIHQLLYVNDFTADVLVSEDSGAVTKAGGPTGKVIPFTEFLKREAP